MEKDKKANAKNFFYSTTLLSFKESRRNIFSVLCCRFVFIRSYFSYLKNAYGTLFVIPFYCYDIVWFPYIAYQ